MSKTKKTDEEISKGVVKTTFSRLGKEKWKKTYDLEEPEACEKMKEGMVSLSNNLTGRERIKNIAVSARTCLEELGLPGTSGVYYQTAQGSKIIPEREGKKKLESGGRISTSLLTQYLKKIGYDQQDNEYLLAEIIVMADRVLMPDNKLDDVIENAFQLGRTFERLEEFKKKDFNLGKSHKGSLEPDINNALDELGEGVKNHKILSWLKGKEIAYQAGDRIIRKNGKNIALNTFRIMASKIRKRRKN